MKSSAALFASAIILGQAAHAQTTWTVPTSAPTVRAAVQLASPGDTITMLPNATDLVGDVVIDKAVTLESCRISFPDNAFGIRITGMIGGDRITLRNVSVTPSGSGFFQHIPEAQGVHIDVPAQAHGIIVLDSVTARGAKMVPGNQGLLVARLGSVGFLARNCSFSGASGDIPFLSSGETGPPGGSGVALQSPGLYLFENCTFEGGRGGNAWWDTFSWFRASAGGPAITASMGTIALVDCDLVEGDGGNAGGATSSPPPNPCAFAAQPGQSSLPTDLYGVSLQPGRPGSVQGCATSYPTPPLRHLGAATDLIVPVSSLRVNTPITIHSMSLGPAQGFTGLLAGFPLRRSVLPGVSGSLWIDQIVWTGLLPPPDPTGWCTFALPPVPAVIGTPIELRLQPVHVANNLVIVLGSPRSITVVP